MNPNKMMIVRLSLALLMAGTALGAGAEAQTGFPAVRENAGDALTRHLRTISDQPRNVSALTGAGRAALQLGDPQAALTFFARAEEIAPRDGRIKAGMGAAFVQMEQVHAALKFFQDAASLGVPEAEFAGDRGLAHDLNGDPRRAQADYNVALRRQEDAEVRRRLALSLAISGERDKALAMIDAQLRAHDRAAWRVRSFILALTGDAAEATRSAEAVMPAQAAQMRPFFAALPALRPAERAMAVHFGHFPNDGRSLASAPQYASVAPAQSAVAPPATQRSSLPQRSARAEPTSTAPRRRPGSEERRQEERPSSSSYFRERYGWSDRAPTRRTKPEAQQPAVLANARGTASTQPSRTSPPVQQQRPTLVPAIPAQQPPVQAQSLATAQRPLGVGSQPIQNVPAQPVQSQPAAPFQQRPVPLQPAVSRPIVTTQLQPVQQGPVAVAPAQQQASTPQPSAPLAATPGQTPPLNTPVLQTISPVTTPAQGSVPGAAQAAGPGFSLQPPQSAPAQTQPSPPVRVADLAASIAGPEVPAANSPPLASTPAQAPARSTGLAGIVAAIESLPTEADRAAKPVATQLASNSATKPAYGPRFETKPAPAKPVPAKEALKKAAEKKETSTEQNPAAVKLAKKEDAKGGAKKEDLKAGAKKEEVKAPPKKEDPAKKEPSRHWVQIAGGANEAAMTREFVRLKTKAPKLLAARTAWTTPLRATNRLLVGPFKSAEEAQEFVNELAKLDLPAFSWTSPAGQEIAKLSLK